MVTPRKKPEDKLKTGRKSGYNDEIGERICRATATSSRGLEHLCKENEGFPNPETVYGWVLDFPDFAKKYKEAKELQQNVLVDEMRKIADDDSKDMIPNDKGLVSNPTAVARAKLRIDTLKWHASKLAPKVYGDKVQQEVTLIKHEDTIEALK